MHAFSPFPNSIKILRQSAVTFSLIQVFSIRPSLLVSILILLLSCSGISARAGGAPVAMQVHPLVKKQFCTGVPTAVAVSVQSRISQFSGTIEAWFGERRTASLYQRIIQIGQGSYLFFLYPYPGSDFTQKLTVRLLSEGGTLLDSQNFPAISRMDTYLRVLALLGKRRFPRRARDQLTLNTKDAEASFLRGQDSWRALVTPVFQADYLPDEWYGYCAFNVVVWNGRCERLSVSRRRALRDWVARGGRLVLMPQAGDLFIRSPFPQDFPNIQLQSRPEKRAASLGPIFDSPQFPTAGSELFVERGFGFGQIVLLRYDLRNGSPAVLKPMIRALTGRPMATVIKELKKINSLDSSLNSESRIQRLLRKILTVKSGYLVFAFRPILWMSLFYLLIVCFGDYFLLRYLRKETWTWLTFPVIIIAFSCFSYFFFFNSKVQHAELASILIDDISVDGRGFSRNQLRCARAGRGSPFHLEIPLDHRIILDPPTRETSWFGLSSFTEKTQRLNQKIFSNTRQVVELPGPGNAFFFFHHSWSPPPPKSLPFTTDLTGIGDSLYGAVSSNIDGQVLAAFILYRNWFFELDHELNIVKRSWNCQNNAHIQQQIEEITGRLQKVATQRNIQNEIGNRLLFHLFKTALAVREKQASPLVLGQDKNSGTQAIWGLDYNLSDERALLCAFFKRKHKTKGKTGGIYCVRQVCPVSFHAPVP